jgi:hypothetical protein
MTPPHEVHTLQQSLKEGVCIFTIGSKTVLYSHNYSREILEETFMLRCNESWFSRRIGDLGEDELHEHTPPRVNTSEEVWLRTRVAAYPRLPLHDIYFVPHTARTRSHPCDVRVPAS